MLKDIQNTIWKRHANPWSVWTRFLAIPLMILAILSRDWIGIWCIVPIVLVVAWLALNTFIFNPIEDPQTWVSKGIYGEQYWIQKKVAIPLIQKIINRYLIAMGILGMLLCGYGLYELQICQTIFGASLIVVAQLWRIDRFSILYDDYIRKDL